MERKTIKEIKKDIEIFVKEEIPKRRTECKMEGHKNVFWNQYWITNHSRHIDKVKGMCSYCLTALERGLNEEEHKAINNFYIQLNEPVTI